MSYKNYLFDLDGTLTDPGAGITNSILYAFKKFGLPPLPMEILKTFIGPPLLESFRLHCGVTSEEAGLLLTYYREYFKEKGMFENEVYPEIPETLAALTKRGTRLFIATSKPEPFAKEILAHFDLAKYFEFVGGNTLDEKRSKKEDVIRYVMQENALLPADCIMIGDRCHDIEGARACGIPVAAVTFGYGNDQEYRMADHIINTPKELLQL